MTTIVQIGVCDAKDHVQEYIKSSDHNDLFCIFIEANPYSIPLIYDAYRFLKNKIVSNIAISTYNGTIKLFLPPWYKTGDAQVASVNKDHVVMHQIHESTVQEIEIPCLTLNSYLNSILGFGDNNTIDRLYIDVEGHDVDIILSTDFSKLNIKEIFFETAHTDGTFSGTSSIYTDRFISTANYLEKFNYKLNKIYSEIASASFIKK